MKPKIVLSILLNLAAVAVPAAVLSYVYGPGATVDPQSAKDILALLGGSVFAFTVSLGAAVLLRGADKPMLIALLEDIFKGDEGARPTRPPRRRAA